MIFFIGFLSAVMFTHGSLNAQGTINESDVMAKLDEVAKGQEEILAAVNSLKEDIYLIKIRVTQNQ